jgi:hypothetical protein
MQNEESTKDPGGLSRRDVLKRMAAGTAIAWTAPVLMSFNTPAFAVSPVCAEPCDARCGDFGDHMCGNSGPFGCYCSRDVDGNCFCWEDHFCDDLPDCSVGTPNNGCPDGWRCVSTCCDQTGGYSLKCFPPCGTNYSVQPDAQLRISSSSVRSTGSGR